MKIGAGEIVTLLIAVLGTLSIYLKNKYSKKDKTIQEEYEDDKKKIDEAIASRDPDVNNGIIDELLPPPGSEIHSSGDMQSK